ncbi:MAG: YitT family protein [Saprospiraceae bacterium]|nr:YitT family protein [Saprospiraceae bacterium]
MNKIAFKDLAVEMLQVAIAIILASIGLKAFLLPNGFLDGGVTGIAILLSSVFDLDISFVLPIVSIPFFIIGYFTITKRILFKSIVAILLLSVAIHLENFGAVTDDKVIIATFGGVFLGGGIGLAIRGGSVLDASELLGLYFNEKFGFSIGSIILTFNLFLFGITAIVISPEVAMYSILTYIVTSKAIDFTIQGFENHVGLIIVSAKSAEIQDAFQDKIGQGITVYQGIRGYGKSGATEASEIIHVVANRIDAKRINRLIDQIDKQAFITEFDINKTKGGKIRSLLEKR